MNIFYKNLQNKSVGITVDPLWTVLELKNAIRDKEGIPIKCFWLTYNGKLLSDIKTVSDHKLERDSTIFMHLRVGTREVIFK